MKVESETWKPGDRARHLNRVLAASGARNVAWAVLEAMCRLSDFKRPEVTVTKPQLVDEARRELKAIKRGLRTLREEGSIVPVRGYQGGRGNAVTYRLTIRAGADLDAPLGIAENEVWASVCARYQQIDKGAYSAWISQLEFDGIEGDTLHLVAGSKFIAERCKRDYGDTILGLATARQPSLRRVEFLT